MKVFMNFDLVGSYQDQVLAFVLLTANWVILYAIVHNTLRSPSLKKKVLADTRNRVISIVHGVLSFFMAGYEFYATDNFSLPNTQFQTFICIFSLSYSFYDTFGCYYYGLADPGMYFHHMCCLIGLVCPLYYGYGAIVALGGLFTAEISNFPMHLRVILRSYGLKYTRAYEFFENTYIIFYSLFRGIVCPIYVMLPAFRAQNMPIIIIIISFGLVGQSMYYIVQMKKLMARKLKNYKEMNQKQIKYRWFKEDKKISQLSFYKKATDPHIF